MNRVHSTAKTQLRIGHVPGSSPAAFQVVRLGDGKSCAPVSPLPPSGFPVEGCPDSDLLNELQWYLETFLDFPFPPQTDHAERVLNSLRAWGQQAFLALFDNRIAGAFFDAATAEDYSALYLEIASDDSQVLAWPWEALCDPRAGWLAHTCQIERRLNTPYDPQRLPSNLPQDRVNILLVIARPYGNRDVGFRSVGRPLVDLIEHDHLPAHVDLLRPPTFDRLRQHLREHPGYYHILHFDGHGAYAASTQQAGGYTMQAAEGMLVFEKENGQPDPISSEKLGTLLKECALPGVVLNACQSGMVDAKGKDPFASVATTLLRSGMRDVVAMAYSLYVSGAQQFLPSFYGRLFEVGDMAAAVRAGRQQMWRNDARHSPRGDFPLQDWLLPVLYRQDPISFSFASEKGAAKKEAPSQLPEDLQRDKDPYGFVGRDSAILEMERAMLRKPAGILIQGLGGAGKTTLTRGFLRWLDVTGGLGKGCFWLPFQDIRSAEYVFKELGAVVPDGTFGTLKTGDKIAKLGEVFREQRYVIVWDNFESAAGIAGTSITANLPEEDRRLLAQLLDELRGGATKVIITSRSTEDWLGPQRRYLVSLGGLDREERWEYCGVILRDLGLTIDRSDENLVGLMELLGGHPLSMRIILPRLERMTAVQVLTALRSNFASMSGAGDEAEKRLYATLEFVRQSLPEELRPLLVPLSMHDGFVDADYLAAMTKQVDEAWTRKQVDDLMQLLMLAGLLRDQGQAIYQMHPLLTSYLRSRMNREDARFKQWSRAFVSIMAHVANQLGPLELHKQRGGFYYYGPSFHAALMLAEELEDFAESGVLIQSLARFALNSQNLAEAFRLYQALATTALRLDNEGGEAAAYHQMGRVAEEQWKMEEAEAWYRKSLAIEEKLKNERGAAQTYHQLGLLALRQGRFDEARALYKRTYETMESLDNEIDLAPVSQQLGNLALQQQDYKEATHWFQKSLSIEEKYNNEPGAALSYLALGMVEAALQEFTKAESWYLKAVEIQERLDMDHASSGTYNQLGLLEQARGRFQHAEYWHHRSLRIRERFRDRHGAAGSYGNLGICVGASGRFSECGKWLVMSYRGFQDSGDTRGMDRTASNFRFYHQRAPDVDKVLLREMWVDGGLGSINELLEGSDE